MTWDSVLDDPSYYLQAKSQIIQYVFSIIVLLLRLRVAKNAQGTNLREVPLGMHVLRRF